MQLKLVRSLRRVIIRRAVFVCNHPDLGLVFIDRSVFQRRWRPNLDECKTKGSLVDRARIALRLIFDDDLVKMKRAVMIPTRNAPGVIVEQTVFVVSAVFGSVFRNAPEKLFVSADEHELGAEVKRTLRVRSPEEIAKKLG